MSYQPYQSDSKTAFGSLKTESSTSIFNQIFIYGINDRLFTTSTTGSGVTPDVIDSTARVQTGAAINSGSVLQSRKHLKYHASIGCEALFTGVFTTGVVGSTQYLGVLNNIDGFAFGYQDNVFGVLHRNANKTSPDDEIFIPQTSWNVDKSDGSDVLPLIDWTKGNVFKIQYQYLGFGIINFFVEKPDTGRFTLVHKIHYANSNTVPSVSNPNLPYRMIVQNTTNNTNIVLRGGSIGMNIEGRHPRGLIPLSYYNTLGATTTETNVLTIRPIDPYNGMENNESYRPILLSLAGDGFSASKACIVNLRLDATLSAPSFTSTTDSFMEYDLSASTVTNGTTVFTVLISGDTSEVINLRDFNLQFNNQSLSITAMTLSGTGDVTASLSFIEDL